MYLYLCCFLISDFCFLVLVLKCACKYVCVIYTCIQIYFYMEIHVNCIISTVPLGPLAMGVPGELKALNTAWKRWGRLPWQYDFPLASTHRFIHTHEPIIV